MYTIKYYSKHTSLVHDMKPTPAAPFLPPQRDHAGHVARAHPVDQHPPPDPGHPLRRQPGQPLHVGVRNRCPQDPLRRLLRPLLLRRDAAAAALRPRRAAVKGEFLEGATHVLHGTVLLAVVAVVALPVAAGVAGVGGGLARGAAAGVRRRVCGVLRPWRSKKLWLILISKVLRLICLYKYS